MYDLYFYSMQPGIVQFDDFAREDYRIDALKEKLKASSARETSPTVTPQQQQPQRKNSFVHY